MITNGVFNAKDIRGLDIVIADIGATNARFAHLDPNGDIHNIQKYKCKDFLTLANAYEEYVESFNGEKPSIECLAIAIACPVVADRIEMTNFRWSFSVTRMAKKLKLKHFVVINDFTAIAWAIPALTQEDYEEIGLCVQRDPSGAIGLLGPGTGLGVSGLIPDGKGHFWPIAGEGGHVTLAACNDWESEVLVELRQKFQHVSAERVLSGQGLINLYDAIARIYNIQHDDPDAKEIAERAINVSDSIAEKAMETFAGFLGTVASNLAVTLGATGGIYIAGGILPQWGDKFDQALFRYRFHAKGRYGDYMAQIPTYKITHPHTALVGLKQCLYQQAGIV